MAIDRAWHQLDQRARNEMSGLLFTTAQRQHLDFLCWLRRQGLLNEYPLGRDYTGSPTPQVSYLLDVAYQVLNPTPLPQLWRGRGR